MNYVKALTLLCLCVCLSIELFKEETLHVLRHDIIFLLI